MKDINLKKYIDDTDINLEKVLDNLSLPKSDIVKYFHKNIWKKVVIFIWWNQINWSISPFMHNYNAYINNDPLSYLLFDMSKNDTKIDDVIKYMETDSTIVWANVSMPYKLEVYEYLKNNDCLDKSAIFAWAVNTIVKRWWKLIWYNTDIEWIINPLKEKIWNIEVPNRWYILWAWWASRAVICGLVMLWIKEITIFNRSEWKLKETNDHFNKLEVKEIMKSFCKDKFKIDTVIYDVLSSDWEVRKYFDKPWILVNTLPFWFKENLPRYPINTKDLDWIIKNINLYFDIVYDLNYGVTPLSQYIKSKFWNISVCSWIDMVIWQAWKWYEMWSEWWKFQVKKIKQLI